MTAADFVHKSTNRLMRGNMNTINGVETDYVVSTVKAGVMLGVATVVAARRADELAYTRQQHTDSPRKAGQPRKIHLDDIPLMRVLTTSGLMGPTRLLVLAALRAKRLGGTFTTQLHEVIALAAVTTARTERARLDVRRFLKAADIKPRAPKTEGEKAAKAGSLIAARYGSSPIGVCDAATIAYIMASEETPRCARLAITANTSLLVVSDTVKPRGNYTNLASLVVSGVDEILERDGCVVVLSREEVLRCR